MALEQQDDAFQRWLSTWGQPQQPVAPVAPLPAPEPIQQVATVPSNEEIAQAASMPAVVDPVVAASAQPIPQEQPLAPVGSAPPVNAFGMPLEEPPSVAPEPVPAVPFDPLAPQTWAPIPAPEPQLAPVGHMRTSVAPGEQSLSADEILALDPVARARYSAEQDQKLADFARQRQAEIQLQDQQRADQEWADYQKSKQRSEQLLAQVQADAEALANTKMEKYAPGLGDVLGIVLGGLGSAATGGQNVGLQMVQRNIERDWERQKIEHERRAEGIQRKANLYGQLREAGYNDYQAATVFRMASLGRAREQLLTEMQNFDPRGTAARNIASTVQQTQAAMQAAAQQFAQHQFDNDLKASKDAREWLEAQDKHNAAAKKLAGGGVGGIVRPPEYFEALGLPKPPWAMSDKEHAAWMQHSKTAKDLAPADPNSPKARKELADADEAEAKAEAARSGYAIANPETGSPLVNADKKPFVVMDAEERKRLRSISGAAANIRKLADRMQELKKKYGGAIDSLGSEEAQELRSLASMIDFETFKAFDLGAPSEGDKALAEGARGGVGVTSFVKDATPGFQAFADSVEKKALGHLRAAGYTGAPLKFSRASDLPTPKATVTDELLNRAMQSPYAPAVDPASPIDVASASTPAQQKLNNSYETDVKGLAATAQSSSNEQDKRAARAALENLAQKHPTEAGRAFAAQMLKSLPGTTPVRER